MILKIIKRTLSLALSVTLIPLGIPAESAYAQQDQAPSQASSQPAPSAAPAVAPLSADQLNAMVAPIALYPDALVAQVLAAAMYPEEVAFADDWLSQNPTLTGTSLAQAVDQQQWDPSVKALTQFPTVLHDLAKNLSWTSSLGQAFGNQQSDVMAAVQTMRARAQAAGTLQSTPQLTVVQQSPQTIVIQPANPQVVYVPQYNPTVVYGSPFVVPMYTPPVAIATAAVSFGAGVAIGAAFGGGGFVGGGFVGGGGGFGWGFHSWGCNWGGGGGVSYQNNTYINRTVINRTTINRTNINRTNINNNTFNHNGDRTGGGGNYPDPNRGVPNGGHNGDHGLIGGQGGVQRTGFNTRPVDQREGDPQRNPSFNGDRGTNSYRPNQPRSYMSGNGDRDREAADRGRQSMHPEQQRQQRQRPEQQHAFHPAPHNNGGGHRR